MGRGKRVVALLGCLLAAAGARAEAPSFFDRIDSSWLVLAPVEWEARLEFDGAIETTELAEESIETRDGRLREGIRLRQEGYSLDPRILSFSVELEPTFEQNRFETPNRTDSGDALFLRYNVGVRALQGTPGPFAYFANASRSSGTTTSSLGTRSEFVTRTEAIGANWKTRIFPSTLELTQRSRDQTFRTGLTDRSTRIDEVERTLRFRGGSSKMGVLGEYTMFDDRAGVIDRDHAVARLEATNNYRWGKGSEARFLTTYFNRSRFLPIEQFRSAKHVRLQHTRDLYSTYEHDFFLSKQDTKTVRQSGTFTLNHNLYQNLFTELRGRVTTEDFEVGTRDEYEADLNLRYEKGIFWDGRLSAGVGAGYRLTDRVGTGGLLQVIDESQQVGATRILTLNQRLIETATIVVTDITGTIVYSEGPDYTVVAISESRTQLEIPATSLISVGDTVLVSYQHATLPTQKLVAIPYQYDVSLDFGWITLFHRTSAENEQLIEGVGEELLFDSERTSTGVELRWFELPLWASARAERLHTVSGDIETDSNIFTETLSYTFSPQLAASLGAAQTFTETRDRAGAGGKRQIDVFSGDASVTWRPLPRLGIRSFAAAGLRKDRGFADDHFVAAGVDGTWQFGKFDLTVRFDHNQRGGSAINPRTEDRLMLTLIRRSR